MSIDPDTHPSRREFLRLCCAMPATFVLAACAGSAATFAPTSAPPAPAAAGTPTQAAPPTQAASTAAPVPTQAPATAQAAATSAPAPTTAPAQALAPTPACGDDDEPTPAQTEGPYFTPNSPERVSLLEPGVTGTRLVVAGAVLTTGCQPIARALLEFWQADDSGAYDNVGYRLRGHQFTDDAGRYSLETIVPGLYPGRTRHIHVKVQPAGQATLTSQLYFPNEPRNQTDGIFHPKLVMDVREDGASKAASFDFVLANV